MSASIARSIALVGLVGAIAAAPLFAQSVRIGASRSPDTVRVGDPFHVVLRVAAPAGARVDFPSAADSAVPVEVIAGPRQRAARTPDGSVDVTADYTVAAWTTGAVPISLDSVTVRAGAVVRRIAMPALTIDVRSVLPADTTQRTPRPPREPIADVGLWWLRWAAIAVALLAVVTALILFARRALRRRRAVRAVSEDAYGRAIAAFDALDARGLVALGESGRHLALAADLMRGYLVARFAGIASAAQTSGELIAALASHDDVPTARVADVLTAADLVKFAAAPIAPDRAARAAVDARQIVEATEAAVRARQAQEAAEAEARARAAEAERRAYETERRRASKEAGEDRARGDRAA